MKPRDAYLAGDFGLLNPEQRESVRQRFMSKVAVAPGCWLWQAATYANGYGMFGLHPAPSLAHRTSYLLLVGPIPKGLTIDHICRVKACVNPTHLEVVTNRENILRSDGWSGRNARKTHCVRGHAFNEENTYFRWDGHRQCRACARIVNSRAARRERAKARGGA